METVKDVLYNFMNDVDVVSVVMSYYLEINDELDNPHTMVKTIKDSIRLYNVQMCNCRSHILCRLADEEMKQFIKNENKRFTYALCKNVLKEMKIDARHAFRMILYCKIERNYDEMKKYLLDPEEIVHVNQYISNLIKNKKVGQQAIIGDDKVLRYLDSDFRFFMLDTDNRNYIFLESKWWKLSNLCSSYCKYFCKKYSKFEYEIPFLVP